MSLVESDWLEKNLDNVKIIDCSWHMPQTKRNGFEEYKVRHVPNAIFFDLDDNSKKDTKLPHMLVDKNNWEKIVSKMGIKKEDKIIIYDNSDVISSCRVWYNFLYFGHNSNLISILDGGLKKWVEEKRSTFKEIKNFEYSNYQATENPSLVLNKNQIDSNIKNKVFELVDARSKERFQGEQPEFRKELKSGNIEGSKNLPFIELINKSDKTFKEKNKLIDIFKKHKIDINKNLAFTCGSGITACVLGLANSIISGKKPVIYDGSWAEYGLK